jgi:hypothetical protein
MSLAIGTSEVAAGTSRWARVMPVFVRKKETTLRAGVSRFVEPRRVLPSMAMTTREASTPAACNHARIARSSASGAISCSRYR